MTTVTDKVKPKQNVCLICIDGWGNSPRSDHKGDAIWNAKHPVMQGFSKTYPDSVTEIEAHGLFVGLPEGLMGNSEVGHLNIGAGRVVYQDIVRIDLSIKENRLKDLPNLVSAFERAKKGTGRVHYLGLISDGGVHSHIQHLFALLQAAKEHGVPETFVHFFGDGRDTSPRSSNTYLKQLLEYLQSISYGKLATITGRYYAMDRDKRWERVKVAVDALCHGVGEKTTDPVKTIEERFAKNETDEFLKPIIVDDQGLIKDGDTLLFFNFRSDRMRQIVSTFGVEPRPFEVDIPKNLSITTFTQYNAAFPFPVIFPPQRMDDVLAEWLAKHNVPQCHIAETEKYAHVTFFFNGGTEKQFDGETRDLISSPKVATYDLKPEMSAQEVANKVAERVSEEKFPFVMCNFAPPDMVGHTGIYDAAIHAVEATDAAIGTIYEACKAHGYVLFITADHGNAEKMLAEDGTPHTAHTTAKVPFVMTSNDHKFDPTKPGSLCDVAPTILEVMGLPLPEDMTGKSLLAA
ncbi:cofactor-independent phosphoglycerate mutase [Gonapodya prolifera JEL478]|uniref:2,3-bisphosphoglycerate-independent phosphoglycerate mutase n=1 Tax=Gonapodya prolifera (strain JEL478) TaxID=1344416 RepID=A0A139A9N7_GONPJ|nr:cofactor-independent phosphoglycerate mutase [Gonapodya prolifera JEL478]|eukprot:KXS13457.1 cofactor-independent phosphoglycerate mutase [Gonapodya prolifera JEL478]